jgi:hypothetical protein
MASRLVSQVAFGGNASNNPPDYSWEDYRNYPDAQISTLYVRMNVYFFDTKLGVNVQVTALVALNSMGILMLNPTDQVLLPCPPYC